MCSSRLTPVSFAATRTKRAAATVWADDAGDRRVGRAVDRQLGLRTFTGPSKNRLPAVASSVVLPHAWIVPATWLSPLMF